MTDDPLISTTSIDTVTIDPNNHNTIYAGTGELNYRLFLDGQPGHPQVDRCRSDVDGARRRRLRSGATRSLPGQFPQYNAVGKVRVDPNNSNRVVAGTKTGL